MPIRTCVAFMAISFSPTTWLTDSDACQISFCLEFTEIGLRSKFVGHPNFDPGNMAGSTKRMLCAPHVLWGPDPSNQRTPPSTTRTEGLLQ